MTFSEPPRTNPAREAPPTFARSPADMQSGERKSAAECMFMHRLQTTNMVHLRTAARAPEPEVRAGARRAAGPKPKGMCMGCAAPMLEARAPIGAAPPVARARADHTTRPAQSEVEVLGVQMAG